MLCILSLKNKSWMLISLLASSFSDCWMSARVRRRRQGYLVCLLRTKERFWLNKQMCYMSWNWVGVLHTSVLAYLHIRAFLFSASCWRADRTAVPSVHSRFINRYVFFKFCRRAIRGLWILNVPNLIFSKIKLIFNAFLLELLIWWYGLGGLNEILLFWNYCFQAVLMSWEIQRWIVSCISFVCLLWRPKMLFYALFVFKMLAIVYHFCLFVIALFCKSDDLYNVVCFYEV